MTVRNSIRYIGFIIAAALLAGAVSFWGSAKSYKPVMTPTSNFGRFSAISKDGWIVSGSSISLKGLLSRGNQLELSFNPWRPAGVPPAILRATVCGTVASEFEISAETPSTTFYLSGFCEPSVVKFEVLNPFVPSEADPRELGVQLDHARVTSSIKAPVFKVDQYIIPLVAVFALVCLVAFILLGTSIAPLAAFIVAPLSYWMLSLASGPKLQALYSFWIFAICLTSGLLFARLPMFKMDQSSLSKSFTDSDLKSLSVYSWSAFSAILILAGALRFYGLDFGLPEFYHSDEPRKVAIVGRMMRSGDFNPAYFLHPSLLLYLTALVTKIFSMFGIGADLGPNMLFLAGRSVSAITGTLSVALLFFLTRRLFSNPTALIASALFAVFPLHVTCSRYMKEDALLTFWVLLTALLVVRAVQQNRVNQLYFAGLCAGFAAGSKYTGILTVGLVLLAPWLKSQTLMPELRWLRVSCTAALLAPIGFLICTPYSLIDYQTFLSDFAYERRHMLRGHTVAIDAWSEFWMFHFGRSILPGMTVVPALLSILGLGLFISKRSFQGLFVIGLVLMFYLPAEWVKAKPAPQPERYILPCLPFLAVAAAELIRLTTRSKVALLVVLAVALLVPTNRTIELASEIKNDTRKQ
ncbi:MAG: glycosyltransferase family 39 protein, partial [Bdellovibrionales bacterium]|nr:glycosyltransferase family 39 protein [Bdellovibrionales bacterium]